MKSAERAAIGVFATPDEAQKAIHALHRSGFDPKKISIVAKHSSSEQHAGGVTTTSGELRYWGKWGAFWGGLIGLLFSSGFFFLPGVGPLVAMGPIVHCLTGALEGAAVFGGLTAISAALFKFGISTEALAQYERDLKEGKVLVLVQGSPTEMTKAKDVMSRSGTL